MSPPSVAPPPAASQTDRQEAIVIDVFARRIVGWRVSRTAHASFVIPPAEAEANYYAAQDQLDMAA